MKQIILKSLIFIPVLFFLDWTIMIVVGCISNVCGAKVNFFSTIYYYFGVILMILTFLVIAVLLFKKHVHQALNV